MISINTSILVSSTTVIIDRWYGRFYFACVPFAGAIFAVHLARLVEQSLWHRP